MRNSPVHFEDFIAKYFKGEALEKGLNTPLADLKLDSLRLLDFILELETAFNVTIDVDNVNENMTLAEIKDKIFGMLSSSRTSE